MTENAEITIITEERQSLLVLRGAPSARGYSIDAIIEGWLDEHRKPKTNVDYRSTINEFRVLLWEAGADLIFPSDEEQGIDFIGIVGDMAQYYQSWRSPRSRLSGDVSKATSTRRMAILSSFYKYCLRRRHIKAGNPIDTVLRPQIETYDSADAISSEELASRLRAIPKTEEGLQALALLSVLLTTGRRVAEVQRLTRKDVKLVGKSIRLDFPQTKNDKHMMDTLPIEAALPLARWLNVFYHGDFWNLTPNTPLWVQLYHDSNRGAQLGYHAISNICLRYLGTSKVHTTRHSFAMLMDEDGASVNEIRERLGHSSLATTTRYMDHLKKADANKHSTSIARLLGLRA